MAEAAVEPIGWERALMAAEKVKERLRRATRALDAAGVPYAVVGGNAVAEWVARVDEDAVRNTATSIYSSVRPTHSATALPPATAYGTPASSMRPGRPPQPLLDLLRGHDAPFPTEGFDCSVCHDTRSL